MSGGIETGVARRALREWETTTSTRQIEVQRHGLDELLEDVDDILVNVGVRMVAQGLANPNATEWLCSESRSCDETHQCSPNTVFVRLLGALYDAVPSTPGADEVAVSGEPLAAFPAEGTRREAVAEFRTVLDRILRGESPSGISDGGFTEVAETLGLDSPEAALGVLMDFRERLADRQVHEVVGIRIPIEESLRRAEERLAATRVDLGDSVERSLGVDPSKGGVVRLSRAYFHFNRPASPETAWRRGFDLEEVHAGYAAGRRSDDQEEKVPVTDDLIDHLRDGRDTIVVGRGGSGKSTICKQVADEWFRREETGDVFYRGSGQSAFRAVDDLLDRIRTATAPTLVVFEDSAREETENVYRVIDRIGEHEPVHFLLDARRSDLDEFVPGERESSIGRRLRDHFRELDRYPVPTLSVQECDRIVDHFEAITGTPVDYDGKGLYERVHSGVGAPMLSVSHFLLAGGNDTTGLTDDVVDKFEQLEYPDRETGPGPTIRHEDRDLARTLGTLTQLLSAAPGIEVSPAYCYTLGALRDSNEVADVEDVLRALDGWLVFRRDGQLVSMHEVWSFRFLRYTVAGLRESAVTSNRNYDTTPPIREPLAQRRFFASIETVLAYLTDDDLATTIDRWMSSDASDSGLPRPDEFLKSIADLFSDNPVLAAFVRGREDELIDLGTDAGVSPKTRCDIRLAFARMHRINGATELAKSQLDAVRETIEDLDKAERQRVEANRLFLLGTVKRVEGEQNQAIPYFEAGLEYARAAGDASVQSKCHNYIGLVYRRSGQCDNAVEHYEASLELARELDDESLEAEALYNLGAAKTVARENEAARRFLDDALQVARRVGDRKVELQIHFQRGNIHTYERDLRAAERCFRRSLDLARSVGDRAFAGWNYRSLADVAKRQDDPGRVREYYQRALSTFSEIELPHGQCYVGQELAKFEYERENFDAVEKPATEVIDINEEFGRWPGLAAEMHRYLLAIAKCRGNIDDRCHHAHEQLSLYRDIGDDYRTATSLLDLAAALKDRGDEQALDQYETLLQEGIELLDRADRATAFHGLGTMLQRVGRAAEARFYLRAAIDDYDAADMPLATGRCYYDLGVVDVTLGHEDRALQAFETAISVAKEQLDPRREAVWRHRAGSVAARCSRLELAREHHGRAAKVAASVDAIDRAANAYADFADVLVELDHETAAETAYDTAIEFAQRPSSDLDVEWIEAVQEKRDRVSTDQDG